MHRISLTIVSLLLLSACSAQQEPANSHHHHHEGMEVTGAVPTVDISVFEDSTSGYNVQITTTNFRFAPEHVGQSHQSGEGHAHIYVDDIKVSRVYGEWYYLGLNLEPGNHTISVDLNTNDHMALLHNGEPIADSEVITVSK